MSRLYVIVCDHCAKRWEGAEWPTENWTHVQIFVRNPLRTINVDACSRGCLLHLAEKNDAKEARADPM